MVLPGTHGIGLSGSSFFFENDCLGRVVLRVSWFEYGHVHACT